MHVTYRRPRRSKEQIAELLQEFHSSGLTQTAFAKHHGLKQSTLSLLLKKASLQPSQTARATPAFVEVELPKASVPFDYKVTFGDRLTLEVRSGFVCSELGSLIAVLGRTASQGCGPGAL
jgi:hypothetical protein